MSGWSAQDSARLYQIGEWSDGHFGVSDSGKVVARLTPDGDLDAEIALTDVIERVSSKYEEESRFPMLIRFPEILDTRIRELTEAFASAMGEQAYEGRYRGVFPVKVNQQQQVVEEVARFGKQYGFGLEVGTKPELLAALAHLEDSEGLLICNGYKDIEFVDLALYGRKLGLDVVIVVETPDELPLVQERAAALGVEPTLGIRAKLSTIGEGKWAKSSGDRSPFGLSNPQIIGVIDSLKASGNLGWLKMLHFHLGSQIPNIRTIREAVAEGARIFVNLVNEGAPLTTIDVGGGLAIDYDGSRSATASSRNYDLSEYCIDVVEGVKQICEEADVPHPDIVTESGRAIVAPYSVVVFNILDVTTLDTDQPPGEEPEGSHAMIGNLKDVVEHLGKRSPAECHNDAVYYYDQIKQLFHHGVISIRERAYADEMFTHITRQVVKNWVDEDRPELLDELASKLVDYYYGNFSIFQSLPDFWAIDQLFPIMPIHRLNEEPTRRAVISDITCDCDGQLNRFIDSERGEPTTLPLHSLSDGDEYLVGAFLVGAYQETLGDLHNLFGDTNIVSVAWHGSSFDCTQRLRGDTIADVLKSVEYDVAELQRSMESLCEAAADDGLVSDDERAQILSTYRGSLDGYTYLRN